MMRADQRRTEEGVEMDGGPDTMIRGVVHDIAGALTAIAGWAELALSSDGEIDRAEALSLIRESAATAARLARGLLGGGQDAWADPAEVVAQVARLLRPMATSRDVRVEVDVAGELPELPEGICFGVLWNLAHNAASLSAPSTAISIQLAPHDAGLRIIVSDSGPGMDAAVKARAFEPGFSRRPGGSGLGLSRVNDLARELGGSVELGDNPAGGARIEVWLPGAPPSARAVHRSGVIERGAPEVTRLPEVRVLVVDDDDALRRMLVTSLELRGAHCTQAASLAAARAVSGSWDLALVDLTLGDGSGLRLAERLSVEGRTRHVVCMSGQVSMPPGARFRPDAWLRKPFEPADVLSVAARLLEPDEGSG